jgi:YidC/Oxa1 family membrane protein insertase
MAMSDQSRMLLAATLMMAVLALSWFLASPRGSDPAREPEAARQETAVVQQPDQASEPQDDPLPSVLPDSVVSPRAIVLRIMDEGAVLVEAELSTDGGCVTKWSLTGFPDLSGAVDGSRVNLAANPWLIAMTSTGNRVPFSCESPDTVTVTSRTEIVFTHGAARRVFTFNPGTYAFDVSDEGLSGVITVQAGAIPVTEQDADMRQYFSACWYTNKMTRKKSPSIEGFDGVGNSRWVAAASRYFCIVLLPHSRERVSGFVAPGEGGSPEVSLETESVTVYAGPVGYTVLSALGSDTGKMVDFGFPVIRQLAQLIFLYLERVLSFIGNWGLRIMVLAVTLQILMMPLTRKSYVAMQKMQKLSPAIKEIQKKFASDPQKQQIAMQKLYKESGANPLGGCLPMILQMPVFFAMYRVLGNAVELRGAPFALWVTDLSRPEILIPFQSPILGLQGIGIMALVTAAFMLIQQKMNSASMQQQKGMMYLMPVMMGYFFMKFAAGLNLYWMVYNILSMVNQELIKRKMQAEESV